MDGERFRNDVIRKDPMLVERGPWAWGFGQRVGMTEWIALRLVCSPRYLELVYQNI